MNKNGDKLLKTSGLNEGKRKTAPGSGEETPGSQTIAPVVNDNRALHPGTKRDNSK